MPGEIFLADFGATNLRIGVSRERGPEDIAVYKVAEWQTIDDVLKDYAARKKHNYAGASFYLSHTGHVENGGLSLDYKKNNPWSFRFEDLRAAFGMKNLIPLNDLKASAYAPLFEDTPLFRNFRPGNADAVPDCAVIGIGTGAGHAFLSRRRREVRETYGGHFPLPVETGTQRAVWDIVRKNKKSPHTPVVEDVLSGEGLFQIYAALHDLQGTGAKASSVQDMIEQQAADPLVTRAASLFCEFLGLYAHVLCSVDFAYGGVYLCGGVIDRLRRAGLFDETAFITQFEQNMVPVVANSLKNTPLYIAEHEHVALYGLEVYARENA